MQKKIINKKNKIKLSSKNPNKDTMMDDKCSTTKNLCPNRMPGMHLLYTYIHYIAL